MKQYTELLTDQYYNDNNGSLLVTKLKVYIDSNSVDVGSFRVYVDTDKWGRYNLLKIASVAELNTYMSLKFKDSDTYWYELDVNLTMDDKDTIYFEQSDGAADVQSIVFQANQYTQ